MIAGLLVMDPTLKIMIVTKENVAAHAFAKHFLRLGLPDSINSLVGRLVGYVELQKVRTRRTLMFPRHFETMSCAARRSSLDAVVASTKNAHNRIVLWQSGLRTQMWRLMTKDSSMATWMKLLLSHAHPASALLFGVATI